MTGFREFRFLGRPLEKYRPIFDDSLRVESAGDHFDLGLRKSIHF